MALAVLYLSRSRCERLLSTVLDSHVVCNYVNHVKAHLMALLGMSRVERVDAALLASFGGRSLDLDQSGFEFLGDTGLGDAVADVVT